MAGFSEINAKKMNTQAVSELSRLGLLMFGLGAGARGFQGLGGLGKRNLQPREAPGLLSRRTIDVPISLPQDEEGEKFSHNKRSDGESWFNENVTAPVQEQLVEPFSRAFAGDVKSTTSIPWYLPAAVFGGGAAGYGGYQLADYVMDSRRKSEQQARLDKAKADYTQALTGQSKLGEALDVLCDTMEKKSAALSPDVAGLLAGGGLTAAGLAALSSGLFVYDRAKGKRPEEVLRAAKAKRVRDQWSRTPQPLFAQTVSTAPSEDEMAGSPLDKVAAAKPYPENPKTPKAPAAPSIPSPIKIR